MMNKEDLLKKFSVQTHNVKILDEDFILKEMSGKDRDDYFIRLAKSEKIKTVIDGEEVELPNITGVKGFLISRSLVDENLNPLFTEDELDNISADFIDSAFDEISKINKLTDVEIDEAEKN